MAETPEEVAEKSPASEAAELPRTLWAKLRWVGPSFAVAAAAVGSGEIIQATRLGALGGLTVLWVVFWGVLLKGFIQQEIGRFTVISGTEITVGFGNIPGPRLKGQSWFLWVVLVLLALPILIIIAGIGGAIGGVLTIVAPGLGATAWGTIGMPSPCSSWGRSSADASGSTSTSKSSCSCWWS